MGGTRWGRGTRALALAVPLLVALSAVLLIAAPAPGVVAADALPDIVSDPPDGADLETYVDVPATPSSPAKTRLLLRFNGYVDNEGTGALEITGANPVNQAMTSVVQRIYSTTGGFRDDTSRSPTVVYESADGHNHWHLRAAMRYGLYDATRSTLVAPASKVGFCLADSEHVGLQGPGAGAYTGAGFCEQYHPEAASVRMGVSPGWRDRYGSYLAFQWVDVSNVTPGRYWLGAEADPDNVMIESSEANNGPAFAATDSIVPGWLAQPATMTASGAGPTSVPLSSTVFGSPSTLRYRIESAPSFGTLSASVGAVLAPGASLTYTPSPSYSGYDAFTYSAFDADSPFPVQPAAATIAVHTPGAEPSVTISGAPASLQVATSVQLTAAVVADQAGVTWSVDGVEGGNPTRGTITATGLYTAPATVPNGGIVRIKATSAHASGEITIAIVPTSTPTPAPGPAQPSPPPPPAPSPSPSPPSPAPPPASTPSAEQPAMPPPPPSPSPTATTATTATTSGVVVTKKASAIQAIALGRQGNSLLVSATSARAGTMKFVVRKNGRTVGSCTVRTPGSRSVTCAIALKQPLVTRGTAVTLTLVDSGTIVAFRHAAFLRNYGRSHEGVEYWTKPPASVSLVHHHSS